MQIHTSQIKDSLRILRAERPEVFGAASHRFQLDPPLSRDEVEEFEREHRVSLPTDYRQFLTEVGNGGAGPFYGIFPLGVIDDNFGLRAWRENDGIIGVLSEPFSLTTDWNDLSKMPSQESNLEAAPEFDTQMDAFDESYWASSLMNGAMPICHEGCALRVWLVVSGPGRGLLWEDRRSEYGGVKRMRLADGYPATFAGWYEEWLASCLAKCARR